MDDISISLVKDNQHYIKTPFESEIIRIMVKEGDEVSEGQVLCVLKSSKFYFELECEYPGIVKSIVANEGDIVDKWGNILVVDVKANYGIEDFDIKVNSPDYKLIYQIQQDILPECFYNHESFMDNVSSKREELLYQVVEKAYGKRNMIVPFNVSDLSVNVDNVNGDDVILVEWPDFNSPLLAKRSYFLINPESGKKQYFTCEVNLDDELMISAIVMVDGMLTRYNYGNAPEDVDLEKERVIEIFQ